MANEEKVDLCVIGAGQAGIAAAIEAAALGASVVLVKTGTRQEYERYWSPLATQAFCAAARRAHDIRMAREMGIGADEPRINFARINARVKDVISAAAPDVATERLTALGVDVVVGDGAFESPTRFRIGDRVLKAKKYILATGSRPRVPDIPGLGDSGFFTPETISDISRRPTHLVILGGGGTGMALAQAHLRLGCQVTVIDMVEPLADQDPELARVVRESLQAEGLTLLANTGIVSMRVGEDTIVITVKSGAQETELLASHVLVATGRIANTEGLGLEAARVQSGPDGPVLDRRLRTSNRKICMINEGRGADQAVHAARLRARQLVGDGLVGASVIIPTLVHTDPQIVQVGLTETQAANRHNGRYTVTRAPFAPTDKARAEGRSAGHVKLITQAGGKIVGAGIVGSEAGELASVFALAIGQGLTPDHLQTLVAPYPAYAQTVAELCAQYARTNPPSRARQGRVRLMRLLPW